MDVDIFSDYFGKYPAKELDSNSLNFHKQVITMIKELSAPLILPSTLASPGSVASDSHELKSPCIIKFILLHTTRNVMEADAYGQAVMQGIYKKGYQMLYLTRRMIHPETREPSVKIIVLGHYDAFKHLTLAQRLEHEIRE
ncbi:hypothetical protein FRC11_007128 [Ceratobasidium sp. 423]|nr:hypothetical protein FRC11_007128 [Ceratobasidium sp. 423]